MGFSLTTEENPCFSLTMEEGQRSISGSGTLVRTWNAKASTSTPLSSRFHHVSVVPQAGDQAPTHGPAACLQMTMICLDGAQHCG